MADELEALELRARRADSEALAEFFRLQRSRLWRMVNFRLDRRLKARIDPDDVLQEAYLDAAARLGHYEGDCPAALFTWLRMIVKQTLINAHRRHMGAAMRDAAREATVRDAPFSGTTSASLTRALVGDLTSPSEAAMRAELAERAQDALERMDPIDREVLALRHFEELTNSEVARELGIQPKAASIRYVRAIRRLKEILAQLPGFFTETRDA